MQGCRVPARSASYQDKLSGVQWLRSVLFSPSKPQSPTLTYRIKHVIAQMAPGNQIQLLSPNSSDPLSQDCVYPTKYGDNMVRPGDSCMINARSSFVA